MKLSVIKNFPTYISHAEFQINNVDTLPTKRWSITPHFLSMAAYNDFHPKSTVWKSGKKSNIIVKNPDKHHLCQVIKAHIHVHVDTIYPWHDVMRMALYLYALPPQNPYHGLTMRKTSDKSQLRNILQNSWPVPHKTAMVIKNKKVW